MDDTLTDKILDFIEGAAIFGLMLLPVVFYFGALASK